MTNIERSPRIQSIADRMGLDYEDCLYELQERVAIKMDSHISEHEAKEQAVREMENAQISGGTPPAESDC